MLFFLIERKEDNIYDFFTIQKNNKVVCFSRCPTWHYGDYNTSIPEIFGSDIIYAIAAYAILNGALDIINFLSSKSNEEKLIAYLNLYVTIATIALGIFCVVYFRYLVSILLAFLGVLLLVESIVYFNMKSRLNALLIILSLLIVFGGIILIVSTFGFGSVLPLIKIFSSLLFLSCVIELLFGVTYKNVSSNGGTIMNLLEINSICKTYGTGETAVHALKDVNFSVAKGEFIAVVGESGSGKSTLLNMIGALDTPTSGNVLIDGKNIFTMEDEELTIFRRRNIGFIFQAFNLIPELNVEQNIMFPLLLDYKKPDPIYLEELLTILNLQERRYHLPRQLSGGQQQRVAIGRALITRPMLILADEPTGNLDTQNSNEVIALLKKASKRYEQTIIMITHNRSIASTADRVLQVSDGVITDFGRYNA